MTHAEPASWSLWNKQATNSQIPFWHDSCAWIGIVHDLLVLSGSYLPQSSESNFSLVIPHRVSCLHQPQNLAKSTREKGRGVGVGVHPNLFQVWSQNMPRPCVCWQKHVRMGRMISPFAQIVVLWFFLWQCPQFRIWPLSMLPNSKENKFYCFWFSFLQGAQSLCGAYFHVQTTTDWGVLFPFHPKKGGQVATCVTVVLDVAQWFPPKAKHNTKELRTEPKTLRRGKSLSCTMFAAHLRER